MDNPNPKKTLSSIFAPLAMAAGLIFFQAYMIAPLIPKLATIFNVSEQRIGLIVPAYMLAYGVSVLFYGFLSDKFGRKRILQISLLAFIVLTATTALVQSASQLILLRLLTGLGASGVVPMALALVGDMFKPSERGRPLGLLFAAMEGGMALGSTAGITLEPYTGWRMLFLATAFLAALALWIQVARMGWKQQLHKSGQTSLKKMLGGFYRLLAFPRGLRTYLFVFWNGIFHSGIYTWLGVYFVQKYDLGPLEIGLAILGYGLPGFFFGSLIGRTADRLGRYPIILIGLATAAIATASLALEIPVLVAALAVTLISLGYDLTQPLFAGIVTELGGKKQGGQAMGLNVFALFTGFGLGSLLFGELLKLGLDQALIIFAVVQAVFTIVAAKLLQTEMKLSIK
ncbi:MFS transporter [Salegentibacter sp. F188]|jgi:predicted MFS family arabinose efflux permease|uniref:MFS transporter n=1 Tax=Autumnicola patrickiae TaxID=3075591 RepID=A0ABU3E5S6_9FLAO|nr:MFS transporter [Salegentibacter sp. F188]MDT0691353.1 MFS transporter [Salegentibacter sp. F188]